MRTESAAERAHSKRYAQVSDDGGHSVRNLQAETATATRSTDKLRHLSFMTGRWKKVHSVDLKQSM